MPSLRPRWPSDRWSSPRAAAGPAPTVVASWVDGDLHLWGWDGAHTAAADRPAAGVRHAGLAGRPVPHRPPVVGRGPRSPDGDRIRPASIRMPGEPREPAGSVAQRARASRVRLAGLAERGGRPRRGHGRRRPRHAARPRGARHARRPLGPGARRHRRRRAGRARRRAMPPICFHRRRPRPPSPTSTRRWSTPSPAAASLIAHDWRPPLPSRRDPALSAARSVLRALADPDPTIGGGGLAHPDELAALAARSSATNGANAASPSSCPGSGWSCPTTPTTTGRSASSSSTSSIPVAGARAEDVWDASRRRRRGRRWERSPRRGWPTRSSSSAPTLAGCVETAAELATAHEPATLELDVEEAERFLEQAPAELAQRGIELVGPERLVRAGVSLRGRATPTAGGDHGKRFGREAVVRLALVVADDDGPAAMLGRRAGTGRARRRHAAPQRPALGPHRPGRAAPGPAPAGGPRPRLRRGRRDHVAAAGRGGRARRHRRRRRTPDVDRRAARRPARRAAASRSTSRPAFVGELRPYQRRGLAWLRFLDRLGLGGCLADDMGLGKTATTLAHLLDRPGPHLVICPLSVVHNWEAEAARFAPALRVVVHHGAERAERRARPAPTSSSPRTACCPATSSTSPASTGRRSSPTRRRRSRTRPPTRPRRSARCAPARSWRSPARRSRTGSPSCGRSSTRSTRACSAAASGSATASPSRSSATATARRRPALRADHPAVRAAPHQGRPPARARPAGQDRAGRLGQAHPRAGRALPARRRPAARRRRRHDRDEAPRARARRARPGSSRSATTPPTCLGDGSRLAGRSGKLARFDELVDELLDVGERALVFTQFRRDGRAAACATSPSGSSSRVPFLHGGVIAAAPRRDGRRLPGRRSARRCCSCR